LRKQEIWLDLYTYTSNKKKKERQLAQNVSGCFTGMDDIKYHRKKELKDPLEALDKITLSNKASNVFLYLPS